jgi:hypothetical protein
MSRLKGYLNLVDRSNTSGLTHSNGLGYVIRNFTYATLVIAKVLQATSFCNFKLPVSATSRAPHWTKVQLPQPSAEIMVPKLFIPFSSSRERHDNPPAITGPSMIHLLANAALQVQGHVQLALCEWQHEGTACVPSSTY